ncbi:MAG TPA: SxtJ family membrane protein [Pyrinomonadaceae bacterium]|nr:SxtJ family membrane protein [Pyrinomonadaceae bacterium]
MTKQRRDERAEARRTALVVACVLLAFALWNLYRERAWAVWVFGGTALLLVCAGLFVPALARLFHRFWMSVAVVLGYVNSRVLLSLMYYGVFTPYGFVSRLVGRDPLNRRADARQSYWTPRKTTRQAKEQFERLF